MNILKHTIELSRPLLSLLPSDLKVSVKKLIRYNINSPDYWDAIWAREGEDTWRDFPNKYPHVIAQVPESGALLDIGCGVGVLLRKIREARPQVSLMGADISAAAIEILEKQGIQGVVGGFPKLPLEDDRFDVVLASEVLEHLSDPDQAVRDILRLVKPDGRVILTVPDDCLGPEEEVQHLRKYTHETFMAQLSPYFEQVAMTSVPDLGYKFLVAVCEGPRKALRNG